MTVTKYLPVGERLRRIGALLVKAMPNLDPPLSATVIVARIDRV